MSKRPEPGRVTHVILQPIEHWCQPLPYGEPGERETVCGYCGAPIVRDRDDGPWRWATTGAIGEQMELVL